MPPVVLYGLIQPVLPTACDELWKLYSTIKRSLRLGQLRINAQRLSAHKRIDLLKTKQPVAATSLEAVKWLGNEGSHSSAVLTSSHCIESARYLNHALRVLCDKTDVALIKKAKVINKAKGLVRS